MVSDDGGEAGEDEPDPMKFAPDETRSTIVVRSERIVNALLPAPAMTCVPDSDTDTDTTGAEPVPVPVPATATGVDAGGGESERRRSTPAAPLALGNGGESGGDNGACGGEAVCVTANAELFAADKRADDRFTTFTDEARMAVALPLAFVVGGREGDPAGERGGDVTGEPFAPAAGGENGCVSELECWWCGLTELANGEAFGLSFDTVLVGPAAPAAPATTIVVGPDIRGRAGVDAPVADGRLNIVFGAELISAVLRTFTSPGLTNIT